MPFREGDVFRCPDDCGCELTVTKAGPPTCTGQQDAPTCCCGQTMVKKARGFPPVCRRLRYLVSAPSGWRVAE